MTPAKSRLDLRAPSSLAHVIFHGQSLSVGFMGVPALSKQPAHLGYSFVTGVRSADSLFYEAGEANSDPLTELAPLREREIGAFGETPATACALMLHQLLRDEDGLELEDVPSRVLFSAVGANGTRVRDLLDRDGFETLKLSTLYAVQAARRLGRHYEFSALCWIQGESDYDYGTDAELYAQDVLTLRAMAASIKAGMNARAGELPLLMTQTITHLAYGRERPSIALSQLRLAEMDSIALVCVPTALPFWPHDVHMAAVGYQWLGAYYGLALKRWLWDGVKPRHLHPEEAKVSGCTIDVRFDVPQEPLVIDTVSVPAQPHLGFSVSDHVGEEIKIESVSLLGPSTVRIDLARSTGEEARLRYGWCGDSVKGLGNLRDSAGETIFYQADGYSLPLHNWAPIFELFLN